jgi:tRNA-2-methylthio-N6-dimethylallyladenosine synthase
MDGQVDRETKGDRMRRLLEVQNELVWQENNKFVGRTVKVLVEGVSESDCNTLYGRTDTNIIVNFSGKKEAIGKYAQVEITRALNWSLFGNQVN